MDVVIQSAETNRVIRRAALLLARGQLSAALIQSAKTDYERNEAVKNALKDIEDYRKALERDTE